MGLTQFYGLDVATRPGAVMIPRLSSELLAAAALELLDERPAVVADVGTGSGALALAVAIGAPRSRVWATDTSPAAVALASENVGRHGPAERVFVREGDLLDPVPEPVDVVVANLPYLPLSERGSEADLAGEPAEAVFAEGDGLGPYRRLIRASAERLTPDGALLVQFRRRVLGARRNELETLQRRLEEGTLLGLEAAA